MKPKLWCLQIERCHIYDPLTQVFEFFSHVHIFATSLTDLSKLLINWIFNPLRLTIDLRNFSAENMPNQSFEIDEQSVFMKMTAVSLFPKCLKSQKCPKLIVRKTIYSRLTAQPIFFSQGLVPNVYELPVDFVQTVYALPIQWRGMEMNDF